MGQIFKAVSRPSGCACMLFARALKQESGECIEPSPSGTPKCHMARGSGNTAFVKL